MPDRFCWCLDTNIYSYVYVYIYSYVYICLILYDYACPLIVVPMLVLFDCVDAWAIHPRAYACAIWLYWCLGYKTTCLCYSIVLMPGFVSRLYSLVDDEVISSDDDALCLWWCLFLCACSDAWAFVLAWWHVPVLGLVACACVDARSLELVFHACALACVMMHVLLPRLIHYTYVDRLMPCACA